VRHDARVSTYPAAAHTADIVALRVSAKERLEVLLWERADEPFRGQLALPGGYLATGESLEHSAMRHLSEKVAMQTVAHLEQLETRSEPDRDPRGWTVSTAFLALTGPDSAKPEPPGDTAWYDAGSPPTLAFDHRDLLALAVERLRGKLSYTNIAFGLVPRTFAIADLRVAYRAVLGYDVDPANLLRVLVRGELIVPTGQRRPAGPRGGRPAELYRFTRRELTVSRPLAAFRPRVRRSAPPD